MLRRAGRIRAGHLLLGRTAGPRGNWSKWLHRCLTLPVLMSLTHCPACKHEVSVAAVVCPRCAHPLQGLANAVVEKTSKRLKKQRLWAVLMLFGGFPLTSVLGDWSSLGVLCIVIGALWNIQITLSTWWHHS